MDVKIVKTNALASSVQGRAPRCTVRRVTANGQQFSYRKDLWKKDIKLQEIWTLRCCFNTVCVCCCRFRGAISSRTCWPRRQEIWEKLTLEPLAPVLVISAMQLRRKGFASPPGKHACRVGAAQLHDQPTLW